MVGLFFSSSCLGCNKLHGMPGTVSAHSWGSSSSCLCSGQGMVLRPQGSWHGCLGQQLHSTPDLTSAVPIMSIIMSAIPVSSTAGSGSGSHFFAIFPHPTPTQSFYCRAVRFGAEAHHPRPVEPFLATLLPKVPPRCSQP